MANVYALSCFVMIEKRKKCIIRYVDHSWNGRTIDLDFIRFHQLLTQMFTWIYITRGIYFQVFTMSRNVQ